MKFSYDWIQELSGVRLSAQEAAELLSAKAFEVKAVEGDVLDIDVLANRPDCLSHLGVARELCALTDKQFVAPSYEWQVSEQPSKEVVIKDAEACPRYSALVVKGLKVGPSPKWLRERLEECGMQSINNVVDVTNYVMLELGQPLHAFDLNLVDKIVVRHAKKGEKLQAFPTGRQALDEARTVYDLDDSMLIIADSKNPMAIAGIKGGAATGINNSTTEVLLEAANFRPESIRATSRKLNLRTDASVRFSYGVDPNLTAPALMRAAELLKKAAGGSVERGVIDVYPAPRHELELVLDPEYVRSLLGVTIGDAQIRSMLEKLGFELENWNVRVPTRRSDVVGPEDLIEEVGRVYGFDAIASVAPAMPIFNEHLWVTEDADEAWDEYGFIRERSALGHVLAGAGYSEVYNYVFVPEQTKYELALPQSNEYRWLRTSLVPRMLINARDNLRFTDEVRIFETGHVFDHIGGKESARLGILLASKGDEKQFYVLKGVIDLLAQRLGIDDLSYDDAEPLHFAQRAIIRDDDGKELGFIGVVQSRVADALKLRGNAVVAELDLRALVELAQQEREFEPLPKYPSVVRDIAVLVQEDTKIDDILQVIEDADASGLVQDVDVFDIFEPTGKEKLKAEGDTPEYGKSVAFHVIYRSANHTLTDKEVTAAESAIKQALQENLDAQIR